MSLSSETTYESPNVTYFSANSLNNITVTMSGGGGGGSQFPIGSINNPHDLTNVQSTTVSSTDYWFKCRVSGAVDFYLHASGNVDSIKIYNTVATLPNLLFEADQTKHYENTLSVYSVNTGQITYLLHVSASQTRTITCRINQHVDSHSSYESITWITHSGSARPIQTKLYSACIYLSRDMVQRLNALILYEDFVDFHTFQKQLMWNAGQILCEMLLDIVEPFVVMADTTKEILKRLFSAAGAILDYADPFTDKYEFLEALWDATNWDADENNEKPSHIDTNTWLPRFRTGVCIKVWAQAQNGSATATGFNHFEISSWNPDPNSTVSGIPGYTGEWIVYDDDTVREILEEDLQ